MNRYSWETGLDCRGQDWRQAFVTSSVAVDQIRVLPDWWLSAPGGLLEGLFLEYRTIREPRKLLDVV